MLGAMHARVCPVGNGNVCAPAHRGLEYLLFPSGGVFANQVIAFASGIFQQGAILNLDVSAVISNQSRLSQKPGSHGYAGPPRSQHVCQKLVGQWDDATVDTYAVLAHQ